MYVCPSVHMSHLTKWSLLHQHWEIIDPVMFTTDQSHVDGSVLDLYCRIEPLTHKVLDTFSFHWLEWENWAKNFLGAAPKSFGL